MCLPNNTGGFAWYGHSIIFYHCFLSWFLLVTIQIMPSLKTVSDVTAVRGLHVYSIYLPEHSAPTLRDFSICNLTEVPWLV